MRDAAVKICGHSMKDGFNAFAILSGIVHNQPQDIKSKPARGH